MIIGDQSSFAIECYHESIPNDSERVFGRMCIWVKGNALGNINEPSCMLNVTKYTLERVIEWFQYHGDEELYQLSDSEAFTFLNQTVYSAEYRTQTELSRIYYRYNHYDFLTHGGESFDGKMSFIIAADKNFRILFEDIAGKFHSGHIPIKEFLSVINLFFSWLQSEGKLVFKN
jgi:hypothetical protein